MEEILQQTADAMVAKGCPFRGVLFAGLMVSDGKVSNLVWALLIRSRCAILVYCAWTGLTAVILMDWLIPGPGNLPSESNMLFGDDLFVCLMVSNGKVGVLTCSSVLKLSVLC